MDETTKNLWNAVWTAADKLTQPEAKATDYLVDKLIDAAHAYGVAVGRDGFHRPGEETVLRSLPHDLTPGALRASIDATARAVNDHENRLAALEDMDLSITRSMVNSLHHSACMCADERAALAQRVEALEESRSVHLQAITHLKLNQGEPAWTKADLDALLGRVVALEGQSLPAITASQVISIQELEAALEREKAEHAETLRRYEERGEKLLHYQQRVQDMAKLASLFYRYRPQFPER